LLLRMIASRAPTMCALVLDSISEHFAGHPPWLFAAEALFLGMSRFSSSIQGRKSLPLE